MSSNGEYEWNRSVKARHIPALVEALGGDDGEDVLDVLARVAVGEGSYELERLLRDDHFVPSETFVWSSGFDTSD